MSAGLSFYRTEAAGALAKRKAIFHLGDVVGGGFHLDQWKPAIDQFSEEFLIVARSLNVFDALRMQKIPNLVYVQNGPAAEALLKICPNINTIFYPANSGNIINFIRFPKLTHIFIGHGDSEKGASCHKFFRVYDEIWTAGQAHIDRFKNSGIGFHGVSFRIVGRPALINELDCPPGINGRFLYLPTWEGLFSDNGMSSIALGPAIALQAAKQSGKKAIIKLHPYSGRHENSKLDNIGRFSSAFRKVGCHAEIVDKMVSAIGLMRDSDFLITDVSSVITDYLVYNRPIFVYAPNGSWGGGAVSKLSIPDYCYVFQTLSELLTLIDEVIGRGKDLLRQQRIEALHYLIDVERTRNFAFGREVRRVIGQ
jgi:hypothetical protein